MSIMRMEREEPRVYQEGNCFWFDESYTHEVDFAAHSSETLRVTVYIDALHPGYYKAAHRVEVGHSEDTVGALHSRLLSGELFAESDSAVSTGGLSARPPHVYDVEPPRFRRWVALANQVASERSNVCVFGDQGALFHQVAFEHHNFEKAGVLLGIARRISMLNLNSHGEMYWARAWRQRLEAATIHDLDMLVDSLWVCLARGCKRCPAIELSGLCIPGMHPELREDFFEQFIYMMRMSQAHVRQWLDILELPTPPPENWGLTDEDTQSRLRANAEQLQTMMAER